MDKKARLNYMVSTRDTLDSKTNSIKVWKKIYTMQTETIGEPEWIMSDKVGFETNY